MSTRSARNKPTSIAEAAVSSAIVTSPSSSASHAL
jgi:hypothetical protein